MNRLPKENIKILEQLGIEFVTKHKNQWVDGVLIHTGNEEYFSYKGKRIPDSIIGINEPLGLTVVESILYRALIVVGDGKE